MICHSKLLVGAVFCALVLSVATARPAMAGGEGEQVGACCGNDGSCVVEFVSDCTSDGGFFIPNGTCGTDTCRGACCLANGTCTIDRFANGCTGSDRFLGIGTTCGNNACAGTATCPLINGGFETGNFGGWTQFDDTGFTGVFAGEFAGVLPHGGSFAAAFGPVSSTGGIRQTLPFHAGDSVTISFWYQVGDDPSTPNSFSADFDGQNLISFVNDTTHTSWTQFTFTVTVTADNPVLSFTFYNPPAYGFLDDVTACLAGPACCWTNGDIAGVDPTVVNGQLSHLGGGAGLGNAGQRVADDFFVCGATIQHIFGFDGYMLNNSIEGLRKARLDFYDDCNGAPVGQPFKSYINPVILSESPAPGGYTLVHYQFSFPTDPLWLDGGSGGKSYWVSLVGLTDGQGVDSSFWVTTPIGTPLLGSVPVKRVDPYSSPIGGVPAGVSWDPIAACCIGCVNTIYALDCETCPCVWDNGPVDLGTATRGGSLSGAPGGGYTVRTLDDFVVKPCADVQSCFIEAWIWTNCNPPQGFIEIYDNDCDHPSVTPRYTLTPTRTIATGETYTVGSQQYAGYRLQYYGTPVTLPGGTTLWISAGASGGGSLNQRSFFAYEADCARPCTIRLSPGRFRQPGQVDSNGLPTTGGLPTTRDYAFRIFGSPDRPIAGLPGSTPPRCAADINLDGAVTVQDVFEFLRAWFAGCP